MLGATLVVVVGGGASLALYVGGGAGPSPSTQTNSINLSKGLVGWWKMDGNAKDSTPYGNNGTLYGSPSLTTNQDGLANSAYSLNGTSQYINTNFTVPAQSSSTSFTWALWVYLVSNTNANSVVLGNRATSPWIKLTPSGFEYTTQIINYNMPTGTWSHVVVTKSGSNFTYYLNGAQVATGSSSASAGNTPFYIGYDPGYSTDGYTQASIDDVRVYNRALSPAEITALYNQYNPSLSTDSGENGLVGWWKTQGNANDSSPYANNGTVNGATLTTGREGAANSAYSFNGSSYISTALSWPSSGSLSLWAYPTAHNDWESPAGWKYSPTSGGYALIDEGSGSPGTWRGVFDITGSGENDVTGPSVTLNAWAHLVLTWNKSGSTWTVGFYVNGVSYGTNTQTGTASSTIGPFYFGTAGQSANNNYTGSIEDVRVYNRALTSAEVSNLYHSYNAQVELGGSGASGSVSLGKGLVGYWPFGGNANDSTPYGNNGTVNGATLTTDREGRSNSAYSFNGSSNYIGFSTFPTNNSALTISVWVYPTSFSQSSYGGGTGGTIIDADEDGSSDGYDLGIRNNNKIWWWPQNGKDLFSTNTIPLNAWTLVDVTYQSGTVNMYINGSLDSTDTGASTPNVPTLFKIGAKSWITGYWDGKLSSVRIYNRALNAAEVTALYNEYN